MASESSKLMVLGGTGYISKYLVKASVSLGHPTYVYSKEVTPQTSDSKRELLQEFSVLGVTIVYRFIPSDFGLEEELVKPLKPFQEFLDKKSEVRRAIQAAGIPYTFVSANFLGAYTMNLLFHPHEKSDTLVVYGTIDVKAVFTNEEDPVAYTIKAANDPRTRNRIVNSGPRGNVISLHEFFCYVGEEDRPKFQ